MDLLIRVAKRQAYNCYHEHSELLEPIFQFFLVEPDQSHTMQAVSSKTGV
jgi:hypothetical protein